MGEVGIATVLHAIQNFFDLALVEIAVVRGQISGDAAEPLDVCVAADRAVVLDLALIPTFQAGIDWEIESEVRDIEPHRVVDDVLDGFVVLHDGAFKLHIGDIAPERVFTEGRFDLQLLIDGELLPDRYVLNPDVSTRGRLSLNL